MVKRSLAIFVGTALLLGGVLLQTPRADAVSSSTKARFVTSLVGPAQDTQRKFGVPASVSIAQAIEASAWGTSAVAKKANNYFNTRCSGLMTKVQYAQLADAQVGKPYILGANGPRQFDCSSLVIWVNNQSGAFRMADDTAAGMYNRSRPVSGSPAVGDMVFLRNNPARSNGIGHMAVLTKKLPSGEWRIIEARGRAYGVVRSTLSYWKTRRHYAGLRRLPRITFASTGTTESSAARLYQTGCVTIGSTNYATFSSITGSFYANAAAITSDSVYKGARSAMASLPAYVGALAKVVKPKDPHSYADRIMALIEAYSLTDYDVVPLGLVLKSGSKGIKVSALQHLLTAAGYSTKITGVFDRATVSAVKKLQKAKRLEVDGEAGKYTLSALFAKVADGTTGGRASAVHTLLGGLGYELEENAFGESSVAAVKSFQAMAGRPVTGSVDKQTWAALFMTLTSFQPTVSGTAQVGGTLHALPGAWGPGTVSLTFQWYRGSAAIVGANEATYAVQPDDAGSTLRVRVTGMRPGYTVTARTSLSTAVRPATLAVTPTPTITGTPRVAETLTATAGNWAPAPVALTFQWYRGGAAVKGATGARYVVQADDVGAALTVSVTGRRAGYTTAVKASAATAEVAKGSFSSVSTPKITGTRRAGKQLTARVGEWGPGPVTFTYQWYRGTSRISGATSKDYTTRGADRYKRLYVKVTGSRHGYLTVVKKSAGALIS